MRHSVPSALAAWRPVEAPAAAPRAPEGDGGAAGAEHHGHRRRMLDQLLRGAREALERPLVERSLDLVSPRRLVAHDASSGTSPAVAARAAARSAGSGRSP